MSYQEGRTLVQMVSGIVMLFVYLLVVSTRLQSGVLEFEFVSDWARLILVFIGVSIVLSVVLQIIYHVIFAVVSIAKEKKKHPELTDKELEQRIEQTVVVDEMDRLVDLKSRHVSVVSAGVGFVIMLILMTLNYPASYMLNGLFIAFAFGSIAEEGLQLFYYRVGVQRG